MPEMVSLAVVLGGMAVLGGGARLLVRKSAASGTTRPRSDAVPAATAAALIGVALALGAAATQQPLYGTAAAVAALCTATAIGFAREIATIAGEPAHKVPTLSITAADADGSISAFAGSAAAISAFAIAVLSFELRLIGPSDAAMITLSAFVATLFERWLAGVWRSTGVRWVPAALAALVGAGLAAAFVVLLP